MKLVILIFLSIPVFAKRHSPAQPTDEHNQLSCGLSDSASLAQRIVGGEPAKRGEFPWQVSFKASRQGQLRHFCAGVLVDQRWVVTAAHCVVGMPKFRVYLGEHSLSTNDGTEQEFDPIKIIVHPNYTVAGRVTRFSDIAVLKLNNPVDLTKLGVGTACVPGEEPLDFVTEHNPCVATGWGLLRNNGQPPDVLHKVNVDILKQRDCIAKYNRVAVINDGHVCFGRQNSGVCYGDSGGPLTCKINGRWLVYGVTSFGVDCHDRNDYPAFDSRISTYSKWIWQTVKQN